MSNHLTNDGSDIYWLRMLCNSAYMFVHPTILYVYVNYTLAITGRYYVYKRKKLQSFILSIPAIIMAVLVAVNIFKPVIFDISIPGKYIRLPGMAYAYVLAALYFALGIYITIKHSKNISNRSLWLLFSVYGFVTLGTILQFIFVELQVENLFISIAILYLAIMMHRSEDIIDTRTRLRNVSSFREDIRNSIDNGREFIIVYLKITNYSNLYSIFTYESVTKSLKKVANVFIEEGKNHSTSADFYYLENGRYATVFDKEDYETALPYANQVNKRLKSQNFFEELFVELEICSMMVKIPEDIKDFDELKDIANFYHTELSEGETLHYATEITSHKYYNIERNINTIIEKAINERSFVTYYQPIYSIKEKRFTSAEALIRLNDPEFGFIPPEILISQAEKNGSISRIGRIVFENVCKFMAGEDFKELGLNTIEFNLSASECMNKTLFEETKETIDKYHVDPHRINFEITETSASFAHDIMDENMEKLSALGISFSLDDFGTGYSNISRLLTLPFQFIKIDRSLVLSFELNLNKKAIKDIIALVSNMNKSIIVEGIESKSTLDNFIDLGCDYVQGFYFSKPLPENEFIEFIKKHNH